MPQLSDFYSLSAGVLSKKTDLINSYMYVKEVCQVAYISRYWSKAVFASTSSFLSLSDGTAPSSRGGSYELLHGDLREKQENHNCSHISQENGYSIPVKLKNPRIGVSLTSLTLLSLKNPKSNQHPISPYSNIAESFIKIIGIKKIIANLWSFDCWVNSSCQYQRKCIEKSIKNTNTDVRV